MDRVSGGEGANESSPKIIDPEHKGARVLVRVLPDEKWLSVPRPKLARQLLAAFGLLEETALVIRDGKLLTPDRHIWPDDKIVLKIVASRG